MNEPKAPYKPKLVYLSGPMTGYPNYNFPKFNAVAKQLRETGYLVLNPAEFDPPEDPCWEEYLRVAIHRLTESRIDMVAVLDNWGASKGATLEVHIAHQLVIPVLPYWAVPALVEHPA